jgi:hypothetical protein
VISARPKEARSDNSVAFRSLDIRYRAAFWFVAVVAGLLQASAHGHEMNPDGISYIELGWAAAHSGSHALINGYWSPLYPFLLGVFFRIFHPSLQNEFAAVHFFNFAVFLITAASCEFFLTELIRAQQAAPEASSGSAPIPSGTMQLAGYALFLWSTQFWLGTKVVSPDLIVAAAVFWATALVMRIRRTGGGFETLALIGVALGVGYLAKSAMFPLAFVFLLAAFAVARQQLGAKAAAFRTLLGAAVFAAISLPYVAALSVEKGRATFGDVGRIAYAEYVGGATKSVHWQGEPAGTGTPSHPTRQISRNPALYEFASPVAGSYPPWYDPSYWYDGIRPHFSLAGQSKALLRGANMYLKLFSKSGALWAVLLMLLIFRRSFGWGRFAPGTWWAVAPSTVALAMYSLLLVELRYVAPFALILFLWAIAKLRASPDATPRDLRCIRIALVAAPVAALTFGIARDCVATLHALPDENWAVAQALNRAGLAPGAKLAYIGTGLDAYWAHLGALRIVAEIPDGEVPRYNAAGEACKREVLQQFAETGARVVVTRNKAAADTEGFLPIAGTRYFVLKLAVRR